MPCIAGYIVNLTLQTRGLCQDLKSILVYKSLDNAPLTVIWHAMAQRITASHAKYAHQLSGSIQSPGLDGAEQPNTIFWNLLVEVSTMLYCPPMICCVVRCPVVRPYSAGNTPL